MLCCSFLTQNTTTQLCNSKAKTCGALFCPCFSPHTSCIRCLRSASLCRPAFPTTYSSRLFKWGLHTHVSKKYISRTYLLKYSHYSPPKFKIFGFVHSVLRWMFLSEGRDDKTENKESCKRYVQGIQVEKCLKVLASYSFSKMLMNFETSRWAAVPRGRYLNPCADKEDNIHQ